MLSFALRNQNQLLAFRAAGEPPAQLLLNREGMTGRAANLDVHREQPAIVRKVEEESDRDSLRPGRGDVRGPRSLQRPLGPIAADEPAAPWLGQSDPAAKSSLPRHLDVAGTQGFSLLPAAAEVNKIRGRNSWTPTSATG